MSIWPELEGFYLASLGALIGGSFSDGSVGTTRRNTSRLKGTNVLEARFVASLRIADNSEVFIGASRRNGKNQLAFK